MKPGKTGDSGIDAKTGLIVNRFIGTRGRGYGVKMNCGCKSLREIKKALTMGLAFGIMSESFNTPKGGSEGSTPAVLFYYGEINYEK